jgi:hypothetical protein
MIDEYMLCDILCVLDYARWMVCIVCIIYIIRKVMDGQDRDTKDS